MIICQKIDYCLYDDNLSVIIFYMLKQLVFPQKTLSQKGKTYSKIRLKNQYILNEKRVKKRYVIFPILLCEIPLVN